MKTALLKTPGAVQINPAEAWRVLSLKQLAETRQQAAYSVGKRDSSIAESDGVYDGRKYVNRLPCRTFKPFPCHCTGAVPNQHTFIGRTKTTCSF